MLRAAATILAKDLRLRVRDRSVLLYAVVVPFGLTFLFATILPDTDDLRVRAAVVDEDAGPAAAAFTDQVLPELERLGVLDRVEVDGEAAARTAIEAGELDAAWVLPPGFSETLATGAPVTIEVLVAPDRVIAAEVARGIADAYAARLDGVRLAVGTAAAALGPDAQPPALSAVASRAAALPPPIEVVALVDDADQLSSTSYLAAGMAAFFVFFVVQFGVNGLLEERELGTVPRLLASPIPPTAVQLGKTAGAALLGVVSMTVLAVASAVLLDAAWGPVVGVCVLIVALVLAASALMALVGTFARTAEQAGNLQSIVALVLGMLGGAFFPLPGDAGLLRAASTISPHAWFLRGLGDQVASGSSASVLPAAGAILVFAAVVSVPAVLRIRRAVAW